MSDKPVGRIAKSNRSVGKLYNPSIISQYSPSKHPGRQRSQSGMIRNRSNSVGRIYNPQKAIKAVPNTY